MDTSLEDLKEIKDRVWPIKMIEGVKRGDKMK